MKLAEIQSGKNYLVHSRENWIDAAWGNTYPKVAEQLRACRWTPITDENGNIRRDYKGRVAMKNKRGDIDYVVLKQIRTEWREGVALITNSNRNKRNKWNDAGVRYAEHLKRKAQREREQIEKPIKDEFWKAMNELDSRLWSRTELGNLPIEVMQAITTALKNK